MTTAEMVGYAYEQIHQARTGLNHVSKQPTFGVDHGLHGLLGHGATSPLLP